LFLAQLSGEPSNSFSKIIGQNYQKTIQIGLITCKTNL